jgi:hypothetical protein
MDSERARENSETFLTVLIRLLTPYVPYLMKKAPILTPQQKAQILGDDTAELAKLIAPAATKGHRIPPPCSQHAKKRRYTLEEQVTEILNHPKLSDQDKLDILWLIRQPRPTLMEVDAARRSGIPIHHRLKSSSSRPRAATKPENSRAMRAKHSR